MPRLASWSWSGRVSVVRRVCALPSSSLGGRGAVSQYHANGEISTERGQPAADAAARAVGDAAGWAGAGSLVRSS